MKRLFLSSMAINVLVMGISVITGMLSARYLGPEGRGILAVSTRWSSLFVMLFSIGLPGAVIYLGKQFPYRQRELFGCYLLLGITVGTSGLVIGYLILPHLLGNQSEDVIFLAQIAMFAVPCGVLADGLIGTLQTLSLFRKVMILRVLSPLTTLLIILLLLAFHQYRVGFFIISNVIASAILFVIPLVWISRSIRPRLANVIVTGKILLGKGIQIYGGGLVSSFGVNLDQLIMSLFLNTYALGLYAVATSIGSILASVVIGSIGIFLFPKLMDMASEYRQRQVEQFHAILFYGVAFVSLIGLVSLPFFLPLLYGSQYRNAVLMGQITLISAPINVAYIVLINYLSTEGKFNTATLSEIIGLAAGIGTMLLLIKSLDGVGAAIGITVSAYVKWAFAAYRCTTMGVSLSSLFNVHADSIASLKRFTSRKRALGTTDNH